MSYLGSSAAPLPVAFSGPQSEGFDGGTATFTLSRSVAKVTDIEVVINNVAQSPYDGSYSVSDKTLTTSETVSAGTKNVIVKYRDIALGSLIPGAGTVGKSQHDVANLDGTGAMLIPVGTTAQRPSVPVLGHTRFNTTLGCLEMYDGSQWTTVKAALNASGGTVTDVAGYRYHTFTSSGNLVIVSGNAIAQALVVAGGGGGGSGWYAGGGGAGGMVQASAFTLSVGTYSVVIGAGGSASVNAALTASNGGNSSLTGLTNAIGGGGGGSRAQQSGQTGANGGSGGGAAWPTTSGGSGTGGQGNAGGSNSTGGYGASGGGAGAAGNPGPSSPYGSNGGAGLAWVNGAYYAGGGAGGTDTSTVRTGGIGGGGNASAGASLSCVDGTANTGGGGGGGSGTESGSGLVKPYAGANGGSGIVIIRYQI
jgi:hypothetical protein